MSIHPMILTCRQRHALVASIAVAALAYLGISLWSGWSSVLAAFSRIGPGGLGIALTLSATRCRPCLAA
jgi:hypothetical protein